MPVIIKVIINKYHMRPRSEVNHVKWKTLLGGITLDIYIYMMFQYSLYLFDDLFGNLIKMHYDV